MSVIMRSGSAGKGPNATKSAFMRSGAVRQFKKEQAKKPKEVTKADEVGIKTLSAEVEVRKDDLSDLQKKFEEQEGRPVPNNKKNDMDWIKSKLNS